MRSVMLVVTWLAYLTGWLSGGYSIKYHDYALSEKTKKGLTLLQGILSIVLALAITNNFVARFSFFNKLYAENDLWIAATAFVLLIIFLIAIGSVITIMTDRWKEME